MMVMAKAGKVAVGVGCQIHQRHGYSRRAPVAGPSSSNGNRVGVVCALVPFAIRWVGASCSGEGMQRWLPGETLVVSGHSPGGQPDAKSLQLLVPSAALRRRLPSR